MDPRVFESSEHRTLEEEQLWSFERVELAFFEVSESRGLRSDGTVMVESLWTGELRDLVLAQLREVRRRRRARRYQVETSPVMTGAQQSMVTKESGWRAERVLQN